MFTHNHDFRLVVFVFERKSFPKLTDATSVASMLGEQVLFQRERLACEIAGCTIEHVTYLSEKFYPFDEELRRSLSVRVGRRQFFKYNLYFLAESSSRRIVCGIAAPFAGLAREVFGRMLDSCSASRPSFSKVNLLEAVKQLRAGRNTQAQVTVRSLDIPFAGETNIDRVRFVGKDVVNSPICGDLASVFQSVPARYPGYAPDGCTFMIKNAMGIGFRVETDNHGNFDFRVKGDRAILQSWFNLTRFLNQIKCMEIVDELPWRVLLMSNTMEQGGDQ